jgi:hypothetical protein
MTAAAVAPAAALGLAVVAAATWMLWIACLVTVAGVAFAVERSR